MKRSQQCIVALVALFTSASAMAQETSVVQYLANEGVMITHGETSILFDPLYDNSYGQYQMVPQPILDAIFAGESPYDSVDAVFVSHFHGDHFSASEMLRLLKLLSI